MTTDRITRVDELLRREIAETLFKIMREDDFDLSAVTITHVVTDRSLRHARVLVSIRDHLDDRATMLALLKKHRQEIQQKINKELVLKYTPRLMFELDTSVERGDHVLNLLSTIEKEQEQQNETTQQDDSQEP